ncbi:hypothetical protein DPMN_004639 [Dreissena polymorpha]|uniref:Uncharacterized protein n=1 Tax=Dreissena polymorpha TaxID=45954 RepID=A0A9D4MN61_DREPO|nr:hypothetical protein DPMN_004639 [Dreissena polymorpha]
MVEPTIWPAWEGEKAEQGEECKTRQTYVEPTIWPAWEGREGGSREKIVRQDGPMVEPTIWPAWEEIRQKTGRRVKFHDPRRIRS